MEKRRRTDRVNRDSEIERGKNESESQMANDGEKDGGSDRTQR